MKAEDKLKKINEVETQLASCQSCINTIASAVNTLSMTINSMYVSLGSIKRDVYIELNHETFKDKISMSELFDYDDTLKDFPCTSITQACEQTGMVSNWDYYSLEHEFLKRSWKIKRRKDFDPQPSADDYFKYKNKVIEVIRELYEQKYGPVVQNGYDLFQ